MFCISSQNEESTLFRFLENVGATLRGCLHVPSGVGVGRLAEFILETNYSSRRIIRLSINAKTDFDE